MLRSSDASGLGMIVCSRSSRSACANAEFRNLESMPEDPPELQQVDLPGQQFMFGQDQSKQVSAQAPRRVGTDQDIRVEEDFHETSRKTSSSVRYPLAAANGMMRRRVRSKRIKLSCLRSASRHNLTPCPPKLFAQVVEFDPQLGSETNGDHFSHVIQRLMTTTG